MSAVTRRPFEVRDDLAVIAPYRAPQVNAPVRLNTNESPWSPPEAIVAELKERLLGIELNRYPDREARALREALGARLSWPSDGIWPANGSNEVIQTVLLAFGGSGRTALLFEPTYAMHSHTARVTGTMVVSRSVPEPWELDPREVASTVKEVKPAITFICSPNNPTGTSQRAEVITAALDAGRGLVLIDEAYGEFAATSALGTIGKSDRLCIVRSFSKSWRLAGARLGYLIAHPWMVEAIQVVRLPYHLSALSQALGEVAVRHASMLMTSLKEIIVERERLAQEMARVPGMEVFPSSANFLLFRTPREGTGLWRAMAELGVVVRDFSTVPGLERCLRVTVGTSQQNAVFLETLRRALDDAAENEEGA